MQKVCEEDVEFYTIKPPIGFTLSDYFRGIFGTETWACYQMRNADIIGFYWRFDKWGA